MNITTLSLSDKERMDVVDRCYNSVRQYRNLVGYYTNKNIAVSYLRSKKKGDTNRCWLCTGTLTTDIGKPCCC